MTETFKDYILNKEIDKIVHEHTFGKFRENMPQIESHDDFYRWMYDQGLVGLHVSRTPAQLYLTQRDFNYSKIKDLYYEGDLSIEGLTISVDDFILDGHHRVIAYMLRNGQHSQNIFMQYDVDINQLMLYAVDYNQTKE